MFILRFFTEWEMFWENKELLSFVGFISLVIISAIVAKINEYVRRKM
jgi:hypothetical protein